MKITRTSMLTGITRTLDLDINECQISAYKNGELIQRAFSNLTPEQREFIISGATQEEWNEYIKEEE